MTELNPDLLSGTVSLTVLPQENGRYLCQIVSSLSDPASPSQVFYGQTQEHALAIAFEHLADQFREAIEAAQEPEIEPTLSNPDAESEQPPQHRYHVILHYEQVIEAESRFEALHDVRMGNTIVENAKSVAIEISPDVEQQVIQHEWRF